MLHNIVKITHNIPGLLPWLSFNSAGPVVVRLYNRHKTVPYTASIRRIVNQQNGLSMKNTVMRKYWPDVLNHRTENVFNTTGQPIRLYLESG